MTTKFLVSAAIIFSCLTTSWPETFAQKSAPENSIFTVDFAKVKEGEYENYLEFLRQNWVRARIVAKQKNYIKSFQLLVLPKDEVNDWHFILITEYGTKRQFDEMEKNFAEIFKKQGVKLIKSKSSREMADIVISKEFTSPVP
jgi:uncharacterized protein YfbU (UPF0304 family)